MMTAMTIPILYTAGSGWAAGGDTAAMTEDMRQTAGNLSIGNGIALTQTAT
jgi:hypothetical protein